MLYTDYLISCCDLCVFPTSSLNIQIAERLVSTIFLFITVKVVCVPSLYAGITAPLPFFVAMTAALYSANAGIRAVLQNRHPNEEFSLSEVALAGAGAGAAVSLVMCPTELVKCRMQANPGKY